jgi:hypothetical protein
MARLTNSLLIEGDIPTPDLTNSKLSLEGSSTVNMLDMTYGGQFGYAPNHLEWVNNQAYKTNKIIPIVLELPRFMRSMENPERWIRSARALFELHCRKITGINSTIEVTTNSHPFGGGGQIQEEFTNVKREPSKPKFQFIDKYGRPIQRFLEFWITYGMMDPETKYSLLATLPNAAQLDMLADMYTMTMLFIEPDPMHRKVDKAWLITNMFPKSAGEKTGALDKTEDQEFLTIDVEFAGITQEGLGVDIFAQNIMDKINIQNANPYLRRAFLSGVYGSSQFGGSAEVEIETAEGSKGDLSGIRSNNYFNSVDKIQKQV